MQGQGRAGKRRGGQDEQTHESAGTMLVHEAPRARPGALGSQQTRGVPDPGCGEGRSSGHWVGQEKKVLPPPHTLAELRELSPVSPHPRVLL